MKLPGVDEQTQQRETIDRAMMRINTTIPGQVVSFDAERQTITAIPAIKMRTYIDEVESFVDLPPIPNIPILFPFVSVAGFALTFPVRPGDPCLLHFSQRAIDNWHDRGGIQPPEEGEGSRHHDLTDAFATFAPAPIPEVLEDWEPSGIELRNRAKTSRVTVRDDETEIQVGSTIVVVNSDGEVLMTAPVKYTVTCPVSEYTGTLTADGTIKSKTAIEDPKGTMEEMRTIYNTHTHDGGDTPDQLME
jgi:hypothetical protein